MDLHQLLPQGLARFNKKGDLIDHSSYGRRVIEFHRFVQFRQSQAFESLADFLVSSDPAFHEGYSNRISHSYNSSDILYY